MFNRIKGWFHNKVVKLGLVGAGALAVASQAHATGLVIDFSGLDADYAAVQAALSAELPTLIGYGLIIGSVVWGAKLLWRTFKGMAK